MPGDLHYGDNLDVLRHKVASASVDLIYLDPPFNSDRTYNVTHRESQAQQRAFVDTWRWEDSAERAFAELTGHAPQGVRVPEALGSMMHALKGFLWESQRDTLAYLSMMAIRLVEMRRVLRPTGSLYLHCDPTASHYLKMILDAIFGAERFRNEIIWKRTVPKSLMTKRLPTNHDVILAYSKGDDTIWNSDAVFEPYDLDNLDEKTDRKYSARDAAGRRYQLTSLLNPNPDRPNLTYEFMGVTRVWRWTRERMQEAHARGLIVQSKPGSAPRLKRYLNEQRGKPLDDVWVDIPPVNSQATERIGFQTQKPLPLLERILKLSSRPGDLVLDPFCGCGTTIEAAEKLGRKWIGIDIAIRSIDVIKDRLDENFQPRVWTEHGEPSDVEGAAHLAETNPYDFQWWVVRKLGGQPPKGEKKKGGDGGIDGEMTLRDFESDTRRRVIISVKGGRTLTPEMVKTLESTVRSQKADYGILVTMHQPSTGMRDIARDFGTVPWVKASKLQHKIRIITVPEILAGTVQLPGLNVTPRSQSAPPPPEVRKGETLHLPFPAAVPKKKAEGKGVLKPETKIKKEREAAAVFRVARKERERSEASSVSKPTRKSGRPGR
jgi:DNA modification methylase